MRPSAGSLVAFWEGDALAVGIVAGEEKGRLRLVVAGGREVRLTFARLAWVVEGEGPAPGTGAEQRREAARRIEQAERCLARRAAEVDAAVLWEVASEAGPTSVDAEELAELALGSREGEATAALVRALLDDGLRFRRRGTGWEPRSAEQVERLQTERRRIVERETRTRELFAELREAAGGAEFRARGDDVEQRYLDALERVAVHEEAAPESARALAAEALAASGLRADRPAEGAFRLLRRIGRFAHDDENLQVRRFGLRSEFPPEVLRHADEAVRRGVSRDHREPLLDAPTVSIDSRHTREIDDALSVGRGRDGGFLLGVHIADPGAFVAPGDPVDVEALARGLSHYHPDLRLPMLPAVISEQAASLTAGAERPALSFLVELAPDGEVLGERVVRALVRVSARLDHVEVARSLADRSGPFADLLRDLADLAGALEQRRRARGAVCIDAPEVDLHVDASGAVELERIEAGSPSRRVVTEAMVLAGELAARRLREAGVPALYRRQAPPDRPVEPTGEPIRDPVAVRRVRRSLNRGEVALRPDRHAGLGLDAYSQVTSPLRRFQDLANQRQLVAHLTGAPLPYDQTALEHIAALSERAENEARRAERAADDYWRLRALASRTGEEVEAIVVEVDPRPVVQLVETLWEQPLPSLTGVECGRAVRLRVERVNPRAGLLVLRRVDERA